MTQEIPSDGGKLLPPNPILGTCRSGLSGSDAQSAHDHKLDGLRRHQDQALPVVPPRFRERVGRRAHLPQVQIDRSMAVGLTEFAWSPGSL